MVGRILVFRWSFGALMEVGLQSTLKIWNMDASPAFLGLGLEDRHIPNV